MGIPGMGSGLGEGSRGPEIQGGWWGETKKEEEASDSHSQTPRGMELLNEKDGEMVTPALEPLAGDWLRSPAPSSPLYRMALQALPGTGGCQASRSTSWSSGLSSLFVSTQHPK